MLKYIKKGDAHLDLEKWRAWVEEQMRLQDPPWTPADLARAAKLSDASVSRFLSGERIPEPQSVVKIALALNQSPEDSLRLIGVLPPKKSDTQPAKDLIDYLEPEEYHVVFDYIRWRIQQQRQRKKKE